MSIILNSCNKSTTINLILPINTPFKGNITPSHWNHIITTKTGRPDLAAISILAEIIYWYRPARYAAKYKKTRVEKGGGINSFDNSSNNSHSINTELDNSGNYSSSSGSYDNPQDHHPYFDKSHSHSFGHHHSKSRNSSNSTTTTNSNPPCLKFLGDAWQSSYSYFSNKFKFSHETIRRAFVKLEDMGFIRRDFRTVHLRGQRYNNTLFILLGDKIWQLFTTGNVGNNKSKNTNSFAKTTESIKSSARNLSSLYNSSDSSNISGGGSSNNAFNNSSSNIPNNSSSNTVNSSFSLPKYEGPYPRIVGDHIIDNKSKKRNNIKYRSSESKFFENFEGRVGLVNNGVREVDEVSENKITRVDENKKISGVNKNNITSDVDGAKTDKILVNSKSSVMVLESSKQEKQEDRASASDIQPPHNFINLTSKAAIPNKMQEALEHSAIVDNIKANLGYSNSNNNITTTSYTTTKPKLPLSSFFPITPKEAVSLRLDSGREFDLCYINKLMQHLAKKYPNNSFYGRRQVLQYLSKALKHELRQSPKVNNQNFRFKSEINQEEVKIEKYLSETEYNKDTSLESQLRRKIAAIFTPKFAYELLTNLIITEVEPQNLTVKMHRMIEFDQGKIDLLLSQVKAVYGPSIERIDMTCGSDGEQEIQEAKEAEEIKGTKGVEGPMGINEAKKNCWIKRGERTQGSNGIEREKSTEYVMTASQGLVIVPKLSNMSINNKKPNNINAAGNQCSQITAKVNTNKKTNLSQEAYNHKNSNQEIYQLQNPLWKMIREKLISHYGKDVDKSWFSKLTAIEVTKENKKQDKGKQSNNRGSGNNNVSSSKCNNSSKNTIITNIAASDNNSSLPTLTLIAPTNFIKSWLESNYLAKICQFAQDLNYENYRDIKIIGP